MIKYEIAIACALSFLALLVLIMAEEALLEATNTTKEAKEQIDIMRMHTASVASLQEPIHVRATREP